MKHSSSQCQNRTQDDKIAYSNQGFLKMGQEKILSLLMMSLCTKSHTCTVSITAVHQERKSQQCWSSQQTLRWGRSRHVMFVLHIMSRTVMYQTWMSPKAKRISTKITLGRSYLICCKIIFFHLCIYAFMHELFSVFISEQEFAFCFPLHINVFSKFRHNLDFNTAVVHFVSRHALFCCWVKN